MSRSTRAVLRGAVNEADAMQRRRLPALTAEQREHGKARAAQLGGNSLVAADEDAETTRLMRNWAMWKEGAPVAMASTSAYDLEARGRRDTGSMPVINGEAVEVDHAVIALPPLLYDAVTVRWLGRIRSAIARADALHDHAGDKLDKVRSSTAADQAAACQCGLRTYYRRLTEAHQRIHALLAARKAEAGRARSRYLGNGG